MGDVVSLYGKEELPWKYIGCILKTERSEFDLALKEYSGIVGELERTADFQQNGEIIEEDVIERLENNADEAKNKYMKVMRSILAKMGIEDYNPEHNNVIYDNETGDVWILSDDTLREWVVSKRTKM